MTRTRRKKFCVIWLVVLQTMYWDGAKSRRGTGDGKETGVKEHCIRCLLEEIDPQKYEADIKRLLSCMDRSEKVSEEEYRRRLEVCRACDYLSRGTCNACGCYVELRAAGKRSRCPYKKWQLR